MCMPDRTSGKIILLALFTIGIAVAIGFGGGFVFGKAATSERGIVEELPRFIDVFGEKNPTFDLLREGVEVISEKYVNGTDVTEEDLVYGAMKGMVEALGDPYSVFLEPPDAKMFREDVGGAFEGIGAEIGMRDGMLTVISPLKGSPAENAGLTAGDQILQVDDTETANLSLDAAVQMIRGQKGTTVVLVVAREGKEESFEISIVRDTIKIPNIVLEEKEGGIAYIQLYHFTEKASKDFRDTAEEVLRSDATRIVLDLRNNPGGFLEVSVDIAGWFLEPNLTVVTEDRGGKGKNNSYRTDGSAGLLDYPLVILVNRGSASASEILAGALRDHRGVTIVGEKTFGKGSVQELTNLSDKSSIKITVAKWLTPNGISIQEDGIEPDVVIEMTQEILDSEGDVQLEKAIEVVKGL